MSRLRRGDAGMTLIEVAVTILVISVGTLATIGTYVHFSSATRTARDRAVINSVAQREIERLRPITYSKLGLASTPTTQANSDAPLTGKAAAEAKVTGGIVNPGGEEFTYDNVRMRVYRYITLRIPTCDRLTPKIESELATIFNQALAEVASALPDPCTTGAKTKRITVTVVPVKDGHAEKGVTVSTVVQDPTNINLLDVNTSGLSLKPVTDAITTGNTGSTAPTTSSQTLTLLDTRCSQSARDATVSHTTRDTSQAGFTCGTSGPAPTLMTLAGVPGSGSSPVPDFSTDVTRAATGGLALLRDTQAGSCTASSSMVYSNSEAAQRRYSMHTWASTPPAANLELPTGARASFSFWSSTAGAAPTAARLCVTLRRENTGALLGSSDFSLGSWPSKVTELVTAFDLTAATIPAGERLLLTVWVPQDSGSDLRILYDHPSYQSALSFTTTTGKEFK
jgi:prepilin-type N-terminal cleavage/methylation domain-containing protein